MVTVLFVLVAVLAVGQVTLAVRLWIVRCWLIRLEKLARDAAAACEVCASLLNHAGLLNTVDTCQRTQGRTK